MRLKSRFIVPAATAAAFTVLGVLAAVHARAADLGGPPATLSQIIAAKNAPPSPLAGCYGDVSAAGTFLAIGDRQATGSLGAGCTVTTFGVLIVGGGVRADFGTFTAGAIYGRAGVKINPNLDLYGLAEWRVPNWSVSSTGALYVGAGAETTLLISDVSAFVEGTTSVAQIGRATRDDVTARVGLRWWVH